MTAAGLPRGPRAWAAALALASAAALVACRATPSTAIRLEVVGGDVDFASANITAIRVRTFDASDGPPERTIDEASFELNRGLRFPVSLAIAPRDPAGPNSALGIDVDALSPSPVGGAPDRRLHARVRTGFRRGEIVVVRVVLSQACVDFFECADPATETCENGRCVSAARDPSSLPVWNADAGAAEDAAVVDVPDAAEDAPVDGGVPADAPPVTYSACRMPPETVGYQCPAGTFCTPPPPAGGPASCCQVQMPVRTSCVPGACALPATCRIDPMGHAACCSAAMPVR